MGFPPPFWSSGRPSLCGRSAVHTSVLFVWPLAWSLHLPTLRPRCRPYFVTVWQAARRALSWGAGGHCTCPAAFLLVLGIDAHAGVTALGGCIVLALVSSGLVCPCPCCNVSLPLCLRIVDRAPRGTALTSDANRLRLEPPSRARLGVSLLYSVARVGLPPIWGFSHSLACTLVRVSRVHSEVERGTESMSLTQTNQYYY